MRTEHDGQTLIHGDSFEELPNIADESIDLILTDPPYGVAYRSNFRKEKHDFIVGDDNLEWLGFFAEQAYRVLKDNRHIYVFCNDINLGKFRDALSGAGFNVKRTLVWDKGGQSMGDLRGDYVHVTEFIIFAQKGRRLLNGPRESNLLRFKRANSDRHPTEKPVALLEYLISKSSQEHEVVLDPFVGVGSTVVAAKKLKRRGIGIELVENFYSLAKERLL